MHADGDIAYWWFDHHNGEKFLNPRPAESRLTAAAPHAHAADPVHLMFDQVVQKHLPHAVMLGPDSWLTGSETGFASCKSVVNDRPIARKPSSPWRCR